MQDHGQTTGKATSIATETAQPLRRDLVVVVVSVVKEKELVTHSDAKHHWQQSTSKSSAPKGGERISLHYTSDPKCRGWNTDLCLVVQ